MRSESKRKWDRDNYISGMNPHGKAGHLSPRTVALIKQLRSEGLTLAQVADQAGVCKATVYYHTKPPKSPPPVS